MNYPHLKEGDFSLAKLKSFKVKSHWKPSDIEVKELQRVMSVFGFDHNDVFKQLLDELKTLCDYDI